MNYWQILKATLPVWVIASCFVYCFWGLAPFMGGTSAFVVCLGGAFASEFLMERLTRSKKIDLGPAFLVGSLPRTIIPLFFLVFSLKYYHNALDKITQYAIIASYIAYYLLVLFVTVRLAINKVRSQDEKPDA